jgi:PAS domain S-box-containing protein
LERSKVKAHSPEERRRIAAVQGEPSAERAGTEGEPSVLLHELRVHHLELELQNQQLRDTQLELAASRDRYRALFDGAPFGYLTVQDDGTVLEANRTATALLGLEAPHLVGSRLSAVMDQNDADQFYLRRRAAAALGTTETCDVALRRRDMQVIEARLEIAREADGREGRFRVVMVDIGDLRRAQRGLQESEARFRQLAEHIDDVFYVRELDGRVSYVSPLFEQIWGFPAAWLEGREAGWIDTVDTDDQKRMEAAWARLQKGAAVSEIYRIRRPDGEPRCVQDRAFPVEMDRRIVRYVGVVRDVTHERDLEDALRQAQKMEAAGVLASGVAHNLGNVLQAILASVRLAQRKDSDAPKRLEALDRAAGASLKGGALIDQLMSFARRQDGMIEPRAVPVDSWLGEAVTLLTPLMGDRIRIDVRAAAAEAAVMADPVQLEQILFNVAANARDAMPDGGTLTVGARRAAVDEATARPHGACAGSFVVVTVRDDGCGMDAKTKARIFEPFFTTKGVGKGTGLGLSTAFALVRDFGGWIDVESERGVGTTFSIYLPTLRST